MAAVLFASTPVKSVLSYFGLGGLLPLPSAVQAPSQVEDASDGPVVLPADSAQALASLGMNIPARKADAPTGRQFALRVGERKTEGLVDVREDAIEAELLQGNLPEDLRQFVPVPSSAVINGVRHQARIYVMPDYLAIGDDSDSVRMPMFVATAQRVADAFGARLPTKKVADLAYQYADQVLPFIKLDETTQGESMAHMEDMRWFADHDRLIDAQQRPDSVLRAGHKKDSVISNRRGHVIGGKPQLHQVAIYLPRIQPLRTEPHFHRHSDYSQGVRLVAPIVQVKVGEGDWQKMSYDALLADPRLHLLVSDEGRILPPFNRYPTDRWAGTVHAVPRKAEK